MKLPYKTFESNLIFTDHGVYAAYILDGVQYNFISNEKKFSQRGVLINLIEKIGRGRVKILGKPSFTSYEKMGNEFKKTITGPLKDEGKRYIDIVTNYMTKNCMDKSNQVKKYILVKLQDPQKNVIGMAVDGIELFTEMFNTDEYYIKQSKIDDYKNIEDNLFKSLYSLERATEMDIEWLTKQPFFRGIEGPKLRSYTTENGVDHFYTPTLKKVIRKGEVTLSPNQREIETLGEGVIDFSSLDRYITIEHSNGDISYQRFVSVSNLPPLKFPGNEWIYHLNSLRFPVEWEMDLDIMTPNAILSKIRNRRNKTLDQLENIRDRRSLPENVQKAELEGKSIEDSVTSDKLTYCYTNINFCVFGSSLEQLDERTEELKKYLSKFGKNGIEYQIPMMDQEKLFTEFLPGSRKGTQSFSRYYQVKAIASSMLNADDIIGESVGYPMGFTGALNMPVLIDPRIPALMDTTPAIQSLGGLGNGKTFLMKFNVVMTGLFGGLGIFVDPKCEKVEWEKHIPDIRGMVDKMTLSGDENDRGKLDPFLVADIRNKNGSEKEIAKKEAFQTAISHISTLLDFGRITDESLAIQAACRYAMDHDYPCMERVIEFTKSEYKKNTKLNYLSVEFDKIYNHLINYREFKISSLIFGDENSEPITFRKPINILQIQGLNIPGDNVKNEHYNIEQLLSQVIMSATCNLLEKVSFRTRDKFVYIGYDEIWFAKRSPVGAATIENIRRQGRSLFTALHVNDQNPSGTSDSERNQIGTKIVYKTENVEEAKSVLSFLDLELTESNINLITNMPKHHVLYQDHRKKTALVHVNLIFKEFIEAFSSTPTPKYDDVEEVVDKPEEGEYYEIV